jgi:hypothetical protein
MADNVADWLAPQGTDWNNTPRPSPPTSVQTHSEDSLGKGATRLTSKSCHTGEGRCPWRKSRALVGMSGQFLTSIHRRPAD